MGVVSAQKTSSGFERIEKQTSVMSLKPDMGAVNRVAPKRDKKEKGDKGHARNRPTERKDDNAMTMQWQ